MLGEGCPTTCSAESFRSHRPVWLGTNPFGITPPRSCIVRNACHTVWHRVHAEPLHHYAHRGRLYAESLKTSIHSRILSAALKGLIFRTQRANKPLSAYRLLVQIDSQLVGGQLMPMQQAVVERR